LDHNPVLTGAALELQAAAGRDALLGERIGRATLVALDAHRAPRQQVALQLQR
jgi:hypothetical protein